MFLCFLEPKGFKGVKTAVGCETVHVPLRLRSVELRGRGREGVASLGGRTEGAWSTVWGDGWEMGHFRLEGGEKGDEALIEPFFSSRTRPEECVLPSFL